MTDTDSVDPSTYVFDLRDISRAARQRDPEADFLEWLVIALVTYTDEGKTTTATINQLRERSDGLEKVELAITLNGLPTNTQRLVQRLRESQNDRVRRRASRLMGDIEELTEFREKLHKLCEVVDEADFDLRNKIKRIRAGAGLPALTED